MRSGLRQLIDDKTNEIDDALSSKGAIADRMYSKFLLRQRDKSPPSPSRLAEQISLMNTS